MQITSAGLTETVDFLAALAPPRKKLSVDLEKQSVVSVCVSTTASEGRGPYYSRFNLPHVCNYVAWFGCLMTGGIAGWLTIWFGLRYVKNLHDIRDLKQTATATTTTAVMDAESWRKYVTVARQISTLR